MKNELKNSTKIRVEYPNGKNIRITTWKSVKIQFKGETETWRWRGWFKRSLEEMGTVKTEQGARYTLVEINPLNLLQRMANALKTRRACGGHTKAEMNDARLNSYYEEAKERSIVIPPEEEWPEGVFNGYGAT